MILNVNVPDLPYERARAASASRGSGTAIVPSRCSGRDPRGRPMYWVGPAGEGADAGEGTDFEAIARRLRLGDAAAGRPDAPRGAADVGEWLRGRAP